MSTTTNDSISHGQPEPSSRLGGGAMFDRIAQRYDRMNAILSVGMHHRWRRNLLVGLGDLAHGDTVLDLATGTADVAIAIAKERQGVDLVGVDPSEGMLAVGREKVSEDGLEDRVKLVVGDAEDLPFEDNTFAATAISFGIRNVPDRMQGLREMTRVTRPGGRVCVLELSMPYGSALSPFARFHVRHVVPRIGGWLAGDKEYRYLQQSIEAFPTPEEFADMMAEAGLVDVQRERQTFGASTLYIGTVPRA